MRWDFFELRSTTTTRGHPYKLFKRQCALPSGPHSLLNGLFNIWNCLPSDTVDFFSLSAFKRTIKCVDFSDFLNFICVLALWVLLLFFLMFFFFFLFLGRLLVLYFSLVAPAICCLFFMHVVCCMCSWQINDDDDDDLFDQKHRVNGILRKDKDLHL